MWFLQDRDIFCKMMKIAEIHQILTHTLGVLPLANILVYTGAIEEISVNHKK
jgi:hypothetical protein